MSKPDTWMPLYIGDYIADTMHLSTEQHGAYLLLLLTAWNRGGRLPNDEAQLALICRADKKAWSRLRAAVLPFFSVEGAQLVQGRLLAEYEKAVKVNAAQKANGAKGGRPKITQTKPTGYLPDNQNHNPDETPSPSPSPLPLTSKATATTNEARPPEKPPLPAPDSGLSTRAEVIATRLRKLEAGRKKRCTINAKDPRVLRWVEAGITDPQLREAYEIAVTEREAASDDGPVNAGFLDVFVAKLLNQPGAASAVVVKAWHETSSGIEAKGAELGIDPPTLDNGGFPAFKSRVFAAAGLSPGRAAA